MSTTKIKQFELSLIRYDNDFKIKSVDKCYGDDLVELLSHFILVIVQLQNKMAEERTTYEDEDIPF
jgi:hypothetical protein